MCLYPKLIKNPKYKLTKKNGGNPPKMEDERVQYVAIGCGNCIECRKQKAREWQIRLGEEIKRDHTGKFVTLSFSDESLEKLCSELKTTESNAVATLAVRRFLERWRKKYKKSCKHWLVTELGQNNTERIHLHGFLFTNEDNDTIADIWQYGNTYTGDYVNQKTVNYCVKYVSKTDEKHPKYKSITLTSPGIGKSYLETMNAKDNRYQGEKTKETYKLPNGTQVGLPIYYRNKIYTEQEREKLWLQRLDKNTRYVLGIEVKADSTQYFAMLEEAQKKNERLGYGTDAKEWKKEAYNASLKHIQKKC